MASIASFEEALAVLDRAWPTICAECVGVVGSGLHYQAIVYHAIRGAGGAPAGQVGLDIFSWLIPQLRSRTARNLTHWEAGSYRRFDSIPDLVIASDDSESAWKGRDFRCRGAKALLVVAVLSSEKAGRAQKVMHRPQPLELDEVVFALRKLAAHREEMKRAFVAALVVVDCAPEEGARMSDATIAAAKREAEALAVQWRYISPPRCEVVETGERLQLE